MLMTAAIVILIVVATALAYTTFTTAISLDYARTEQELQRQRQHLLQELFLKAASHISRNELVMLVKKSFAMDHVVKEGSNQISIDDIVLIFDGDAIKSVSSLDEVSKNP